MYEMVRTTFEKCEVTVNACADLFFIQLLGFLNLCDK